MPRLVLAALALVAIASPAAAQDDAQLWGTVTATTALGSDTELALELITRAGDAAGGIYEVEFGGMVSHEIAKGVKIGIGYIRVPNYRDGAVSNIEDRPRQQISASFPNIAGGTLSARVRLEERFRNTGSDMGLRMRPNIRWAVPLASGSPTRFFVQHESFITLNSTDWGQRSGYERWRNSLGLSTALMKNVEGEIGYLNQLTFGRNGAPDRNDHAATLGLAVRF
ncbi:MAG: DUF2490 domain-containing protein [Sphingomonas sp.]|uniref:DUF2490 domain-containing protein n=1 Tax=Sphingomonas sp. TaxID=28214 RepID=UPI001B2C7F6D|nr:DUF2490 domain-containing protein [Sphingomonas sp.]MBO9624485.1 DUF2490 domain-containing protein [Sphingomonas sp.]